MALDTTAAPLEVSGLSAAYGKHQVLRDVNFTLSPGEIFGLVGLNGAGKTTLIRSILNLRFAAGEIRIFGVSNDKTQARRTLVYLPEKFQPAAQLKGFEHLSILLDYYRQTLDRDKARAVAQGLDLDPAALDKRVSTYSKGMGQKLGLVGSLLVAAPLMILDEPMSGLDPRARVLLKDRLMEARGQGRSIFFSSHILSDIEEMCDRIGVIHGGTMIYLGTPGDFTQRYGGLSLERAFLASLNLSEAAKGG